METKNNQRSLLDIIPEQIIQKSEQITIAPGEHIVRANEPVKYFYVLIQGSAKLIHEDAEAEPLIIDIYHSGDFMGEMEMVDVITKDRSIIAMTRCELIRLGREDFLRLWTESREFSLRLLRIHCLRLLRAGDDKVNSDRTMLSGRVFRLIQLNLNEKDYFRYTKQILSEMVGISMRSLNRTLKDLERDRLIIVSSGTIRLYTEQ